MSTSQPPGEGEPPPVEAVRPGRSRAELIVDELHQIAYSMFGVLPEPMNEFITERALRIVEEQPGHLQALWREPDPVARRRYFVMGPARAAILEYRHAMFADTGPVAGRPHDEALNTLLTVFERLSVPEQRALLLCRIWGLSQREAGALLGVSQTAVSQAIHRAELRMRPLRPDRPD